MNRNLLPAQEQPPKDIVDWDAWLRPVRGDLLRPPEIEQARRELLNVREGRIRPGLDDKVLTEWNGLMLTTLAEAAVAFERTDWLDAAEQNAEFLCETLQLEDGRWLRSWQIEGGARQLGFAADHAAMIEALVKLSEATGKTKWLDVAIRTADVLIEKFSDFSNGIHVGWLFLHGFRLPL